MNLYRRKEWNEFRLEVIRLDGGICVRCGRSPGEGAILQVHHLQYLPGRLPWQYPHNLCEALCKRCHAEEHGMVPPASGWTLIGYDDLEDLIGVCELCQTSLRHVYLVQHETWGLLEVGTDCCDRLTQTDEASVHLRQLQRQATRRKTFVSSPRWMQQERNLYVIKQKSAGGAEVRVAIRAAEVDGARRYRIVVCDKVGEKEFTSLALAKGAVFDLCESPKLDAWMARLFAQRAARRRAK